MTVTLSLSLIGAVVPPRRERAVDRPLRSIRGQAASAVARRSRVDTSERLWHLDRPIGRIVRRSTDRSAWGSNDDACATQNVSEISSRDKILDAAEAALRAARLRRHRARARSPRRVGLGEVVALPPLPRARPQLYAAVVARILDRIEAAPRCARSPPAARRSSGSSAGSTRSSTCSPSIPTLRAPAAALALRGRRPDRRRCPRSARRNATHRRIVGAARALLREGMGAGHLPRRQRAAHCSRRSIGATVFHFASGEFGDEMIGTATVRRPAEVRRRKDEVQGPPPPRPRRRPDATTSRARSDRRWRSILAEYRRKIGDFEVVEIVDEDADRRRCARELDVDVPLELHWTWEYGSEVEELRALYERGKKGQWNAEEDIDWSTPLPRDEWFMPRERRARSCRRVLTHDGRRRGDLPRGGVGRVRATLISQLLHGEQAALQLCGQLTNACPTMDAKWYAGSQVIDEVRHVEVFSKFLQRKMGVDPPDRRRRSRCCSTSCSPRRPGRRRRSACRRLFEGMAVGIMDLIQKRSTRTRSSRDIIRRVQAGRGAPRRLRHPHHAPHWCRSRRPRRWPRWRTSRSTSSRR